MRLRDFVFAYDRAAGLTLHAESITTLLIARGVTTHHYEMRNKYIELIFLSPAVRLAPGIYRLITFLFSPGHMRRRIITLEEFGTSLGRWRT